MNLNKLPPSHERAYIDKMIAAGRIKVTRCPDGAYDPNEHGFRRSRGGIVARHLDPRTIGLTREEFEEQERLQRAAHVGKSAKVSRPARVGARRTR